MSANDPELTCRLAAGGVEPRQRWNFMQSLAVVYRAIAWARMMKWVLVVLVGGITPVNTNMVFEKFADCLAAEEQMRRHYADAFEAWDRGAAMNIQQRREYVRERDLQAKRLLSNVGTCVPHGDGDQQPMAKPQEHQPTPTPPQQPATPRN
jgi:hypothetical protein